MGISIIALIIVAMVPIIAGDFGQRVVGQRSDYPVDDCLDYCADEYPTVKKKSTLLVDQLLLALQRAAQKDVIRGKGIDRSASVLSARSRMGPEDDQMKGMQRRGQTKGQIYWRCYFNPVACFKRK